MSQLPNFAFSTALCHFSLSQQYEADCEESNKHRQKADQMLQSALIMFPGGESTPHPPPFTPPNTTTCPPSQLVLQSPDLYTVCCSLDATAGAVRCAARLIGHITSLLWTKESNRVKYELTVFKVVPN